MKNKFYWRTKITWLFETFPSRTNEKSNSAVEGNKCEINILVFNEDKVFCVQKKRIR